MTKFKNEIRIDVVMAIARGARLKAPPGITELREIWLGRGIEHFYQEELPKSSEQNNITREVLK